MSGPTTTAAPPAVSWLRQNAMQVLIAALLALGTFVATEVLAEVQALQADLRALDGNLNAALRDGAALRETVGRLRHDVDRNTDRLDELDSCR